MGDREIRTSPHSCRHRRLFPAAVSSVSPEFEIVRRQKARPHTQLARAFHAGPTRWVPISVTLPVGVHYKSQALSAKGCLVICCRPEMTHKAIHAWFFPLLSLAVGLGYTHWFGGRFIPFLGLLMGPPDTNCFPAYGAPAMLAGLFGFLRARPKEIWSYGLLMWTPQAIRFGTDGRFTPGLGLEGLLS
jgi:hypothetical protein